MPPCLSPPGSTRSCARRSSSAAAVAPGDGPVSPRLAPGCPWSARALWAQAWCRIPRRRMHRAPDRPRRAPTPPRPRRARASTTQASGAASSSSEHESQAELEPVLGFIGRVALDVGLHHHFRMDPEIDPQRLDALVVVWILEQIVPRILRLLDVDALVANEVRDVEIALLVHVVLGLHVRALHRLWCRKSRDAGVGEIGCNARSGNVAGGPPRARRLQCL